MGAFQRVADAAPDGSRTRRRRRAVTLAVAAVLLVAGLAATLAHAQRQRAGTNGIPARSFIGVAVGPGTICQDRERIPAGTAAIDVALSHGAGAPPPARIVVRANDGTVRARGRDARWAGSTTATVPLQGTLRRDVAGSVCVVLPDSGGAQYAPKGVATAEGFSATEGGGAPLPGRIHIEYLAAGTRSWWSFAPTLVQRIGRGHAWSGPSVAALLALLMLAPIALAAWQLVRAEDR